MISDPVTSIPQVRGGTIKIYAVTANTRLFSAPDTPTVDEAGVPGFHSPLWHGLWMPKGTAKRIIAQLNAPGVGALAHPQGRAKFSDLVHEIFPRHPPPPLAPRGP